MEINSNSKISHILKENKEAIDTIASINKHFKKLKNPVLRKVLAPRVTIKEAAKIGNITANEFLKKLAAIGFDVVYDTGTTEDNIPEVHETDIDRSKIIVLDVRPTINAGADPFAEIMAAIKKLDDDETLEIINIFEPTPLIGILKGKGYTSWTEKTSDEEFHSFFTKNSDTSHKDVVAEMPIAEGSFDEKLASYGQNLKEIDVRLLEMPEPMVTILSELEKLPDDHVLFVHHKKIPQFLLPELKTRNYKIMSKELNTGLVELIIFKG